MKLNKVVNFFKSKSVVDFVYLVMMILIVTMIKDMIVSMYKKRKDKQWLNQAFGKTKGGKNVEGFINDGGSLASGVGVSVSGSGSGSGSGCPTSTGTICDKLKFLLCNDNFHILKKYIDADWVNKSGNYYRLNTKGANVYTFGGDITTSKYDGGVGHNDNDSPIRSDEFETRPIQSRDIGGTIRTGGGAIRTYSGIISTKKFIRSLDEWTNAEAGDIFAGDATMSIETILPTSSKLKTKESGDNKFVSTHGSW